MGAPHNQKRYGETWPQRRIDVALTELEAVKGSVILSGGWAWHFLSPPAHVEYKHAHDHKDIDVFVSPQDVALVVSTLTERGFEKVWTRYDRLPSDEEFRRYEKMIDTPDERPLRVMIDFFVRSDVPQRVIDGWSVVEPRYLLSLYSSIHSSDKCFAVQAAVKLLARGIDPQGRPELVQIPQ